MLNYITLEKQRKGKTFQCKTYKSWLNYKPFFHFCILFIEQKFKSNYARIWKKKIFRISVTVYIFVFPLYSFFGARCACTILIYDVKILLGSLWLCLFATEKKNLIKRRKTRCIPRKAKYCEWRDCTNKVNFTIEKMHSFCIVFLSILLLVRLVVIRGGANDASGTYAMHKSGCLSRANVCVCVRVIELNRWMQDVGKIWRWWSRWNL